MGTVRAALAEVAEGHGDEPMLRAVIQALGGNLLATLDALIEIERAPSRHVHDAMRGGASFHGIDHGAVDHAVQRLCYALRPVRRPWREGKT
jgi:hypothetical protein